MMLAAVPFMIVFRFLHIVSGALWVGSAFLFVGFIGPSAAEVGPSAGPLLSAAVKGRKVTKVIVGLGISTVLAGWVMWLHDMSLYGSLGDWVGSSFGFALTIGGILATIAAFVGSIYVGGGVEKLVDLSDEIRASGGPPSPEQEVRIAQLGRQLETHGKLDLVLLLLAVTTMATARYW
jgi:hypothetical protein